MKISIVFAAILALLFASPATAHTHKQHHQHYVHPMVSALGIGLIKMLRASREHEGPVQSGPSSMPTYKYEAPADTYKPVKVHAQWSRRSAPAYSRGSRFANLDGSCRIAAHMGGPCGCWAAEHFFGSPVRNLWLARNWLRFPHTQAAAGTAAVWPNAHHVAPVVAVNGDGTVTVADSWGTHAVSAARLTFVHPTNGYASAF